MKLLAITCLLIVSSLMTSHAAPRVQNPANCDLVCASPHEHDESLASHCGCDPHSHRHNHTSAVPVQLSHGTTLSMCDYLCSIQMGGAACDCSAPILPGK